MQYRELAHLSDLHIGASAENERVAAALCRMLLQSEVDQAVITGDVTHRGRFSELRRFQELFEPLLKLGKVTVVPGNHDRLGEGAGKLLMNDVRVDARAVDGLYLVRLDSTGPHNRSYLSSRGEVGDEVLAELSRTLRAASPGRLCVVLMHHHPLPLPEDSLTEWLAAKMGWPFTAEVPLGTALLEQSVGNCDLLLHGHRHIPREICFTHGPRPLHVYNAGSSTELGGFRIFRHLDGRILGAPRWIGLHQRQPAAARAFGPSALLQCSVD